MRRPAGRGAPRGLRLLAAAPVPVAALMVAAILVLGPASHQALLFRLEGTAVKAVAALGAAAAALAFAPRSRFRLAWGAIAACYAVLAAKTAPVLGDDLLTLRLGTLVANLLAPLGSLLMVWAWFTSGLTPAIPVLRRRILPAVAVTGVLALAVAGPSVVVQVRNLGHEPTALLLVFSGIGDIAGITLLAPLLLIANAMRGRRLAWPWMLLAAGELSWLLYDVVVSLSPGLMSSVAVTRALAEVMRAAGCLYYASAGAAQGLVLRSAAPCPAPGAVRPGR